MTARLPAVAALLALAPAAAGQLPADAQFRYQLAYRVGASPTTTPVAAGGTISYVPGTSLSVDVYLKQTAGATDVFAAEAGLFGGGVRLTFGAVPAFPAGYPAGTAGVLSIAGVSSIQYNTGFNDTVTSNGSRRFTADFAQFAAATDGTAPTGVTGGASGVLLGTFVFATNAAGGTTRIVADRALNPTDNQYIVSNVTYKNLYSLDSPISNRLGGPLVFSVVPVPEPAGLVVVAAGLVLAATRAVKRRSTKSDSVG